jgi:hypothetical protein
MAEEKKPAPKQRKKSAAPKQEAPKQEAPKPAAEKPTPKKAEVSKKILVGSRVKTPFDTISEVYKIEDDYCFVRKQENRKKLYKIHTSKLELVK